MSKALVLVRPGLKTSSTYLGFLVQEFAAVGLYTTDAAGIRVVDVTIRMSKPGRLGNLDLLVLVNSTAGLLDDDTRAQREKGIELALQNAFGGDATNVDVYIVLDIKSGSGEAYNFASIGEMTMEAAQHRADARIAGKQPVRV